MKKIFENKPRLIFWVGFYVVLMATLVGLIVGLEKTDSNVLAMVGDEEITQSDLDQALYGTSFQEGTYSEEDQQEMLNRIIEFEIAKQEAAKMGITVTDEEVMADIQSSLGTAYESYTDAQKTQTQETTRNRLLLDKVKTQALGWREGTFLVFNFHKYFESATDYYQTEEGGNAELIEEQRQAALALANELSSGLNNGTITFEEAKNTLLENEAVGSQAMLPRTPVMWAPFDQVEFTENRGMFEDANLKNKVFELAKNQASEPIADSGVFAGEEKEYRYLVFYVNDSNSGEYANYSEWLDAKKAEYGTTSSLAMWLPASKAFAAPSQCVGACDGDNADLFVTLYYRTKDNNSLTYKQQVMRFYGGALDDYALAPDGSSCGNLKYQLDGKTDNNGQESLCSLDYSFYCGQSRQAYIRFFAGDRDVDDNGIDDSIPELGYYRWDRTRRAEVVKSDGTPADTVNLNSDWTLKRQGTAGNYYWQAPLNLNASDNQEGVQYNGLTVSNAFTWYPRWNSAPTTNLVSPSNGTEYTLPEGATTMNVSVTAIADDAEEDNVKIAFYRNDAVSGYLPSATTFAADDTARTYTFNGLPEGVYTWKAKATDGYAWGSDSVTWSFSIVTASEELCEDPNALNPGGSLPCEYPSGTPSCQLAITPVQGPVPLSIQASISVENIANPQYSIDFDINKNPGWEYQGKSDPFPWPWTYKTPDEYTIRAIETTTGTVCTGVTQVTVKAETDRDDNETAP